MAGHFRLALTVLVALSVVAISTATTTASATRPHLIYILADDYGWADADWHRDANWTEKATPHLSSLVANGVELDNYYSFKFCSPTRSSIQSGRNPIHVNVQNYQPVVWNYVDPSNDPDAGFAGVARNMTGMATMLKSGAGYRTHFAGKWDCGMATWDHTPEGRGYDTSLFYFHHDNDYWTSRVRADDRSQTCPGDANQIVDLFHNKKPARGLNNTASECMTNGHPYPVDPVTKLPRTSCVYEDQTFLNNILGVVDAHPVTEPLFLFWAPHIVHAPLQVPKEFADMYTYVDDPRRATYLAMVRWLDTAVSNLTATLKRKNMWDNTVVVFSSDNGGPVYCDGCAGANNWPLRGGKASNWQGGIRVNAFVSGGLIPIAARGTKLTGLATAWDIYGTFAHLAGVDPTDHKAAAAGLPPVDSVNQWEYFSGATTTPPRTVVPVGSSSCITQGPGCINQWGWGPINETRTIVQALIFDDGKEGKQDLWKLILGAAPYSGWTGPKFPNGSKTNFTNGHCDFTTGCLFHLSADPNEHVDLSGEAAQEARKKRMLALLKTHNETTFSPDRGPGETDPHVLDKPCAAAHNEWNGFWGPFLTE
tara:strand:+ start:64 stop:1842 length:1779 start_codon:yes stop_codon:yes gene_type:complete